jgi:aspartyl-tRNA(Asn)/glutamyl-tRNA(Gln) amidotransferase subunit A
VRTAIEIADAVRRGEERASAVLEECLAAIEARNPSLGAFVHVDADLAMRAAEAVDAKVARGEDPGPLAGVPIGVKDLEDCAGMPTSYGSLLYKGGAPVAADSVHVARLRAAGAVPVGKTATPEFGFPSYTHTKAWGTARNPWDTSRTPGGSSGGSAAAVAAGLVPLCTASDGGGSIRIPAAFTGLPGLKPSYGRIPNPGAAWSETSCWGALTTTVAEAARHLDVAAGPDDRDRASLPPPAVSYERAVTELDVRGLRAAWTLDMGFACVDSEVAEVTHAAAMTLVGAADLELVNRPFAPTDPLKLWLSAGAADMWLHLEPGMWPERAHELTGLNRRGLEQTERWTLGRFARVLHRRHRLEAEVAALFEDVDVLLSPATALPAFAAEGPLPLQVSAEDDRGAGATPFTMIANLCWNPAASLPAGFTSGGLPVGLQIIGRRHADEIVLRLARLFEHAAPWPRHAPPPT